MSEPNANPLLALSHQLQQLAGGMADAVVSVRSHRRPVASGFVWKPGLVVTASEALEADDEISVVVAGGRSTQAQIVGRDPSTDIALLRLDEDVTAPASIIAGDVAGIGQMVLALGRGRHGTTANLGCVSAAGEAWQSRRGGRIDRLIRLDMRLDRHAEGGLVLDAEGHVLGMAVFGPRRRPLVIPMATIERVAPKLMADGRIRRGYLGVGLHPVRLDDASAGVAALADRRATMVVGLEAGGPAQTAGVLLGDIIVAFDGEPVADLRSLFARLSPDSVDKAVELKILRAGQMTSAKVTIGANPAP